MDLVEPYSGSPAGVGLGPPDYACSAMRIGVYIDGFNLYYSARDVCGRSTAGWRWLDIRSLATDLIAARADWPGARLERLIYCTATIERTSNPSGYADQQTYLKALEGGRHRR